MLPGLHIFDLHDLTLCETLAGIKTDFESNRIKAISDYCRGSCNAECNDHHIVVYLENVLHRGYPLGHEDVSKLLVHKNSKVRKISLLLHYKHFPDIKIPSFQKDPSYSVREIYISHSKELIVSSLVRQTKDENPSVRIQALKRLMSFIQEDKYKLPMFKAVCYAISDRLPSVRTCASEIVGYFRGLPDELIEKLLNKQSTGHSGRKIAGALVYGIEDECLEVRMNTVKSLYLLTTTGVVSKVFDFLADSLNDDDEGLRELCASYLRRLSETYVLNVEQEIVKQVCGSLDEKNENIKESILVLLSNLRYEDTAIFDALVPQMDKNIEPRRMFKCIRRIVCKNRNLFFTNIGKFYEHKDIAQVEPSLGDCKYIARLVVLEELRRRGFEFRLERVIEDHFLFLGMMGGRGCRVGEGYVNEFLRDVLLQFLNEENAKDMERHYRAVFRRGSREKSDSCKFICYIYKAIVEWMRTRRQNLLKKIPHLFTNTGFNISVLDEMSGIVTYVRDLSLRSIRHLKYQLDVASSVVARRGMPIRFCIRVRCEGSFSELFVKVGPEAGSCIYIPAKQKVEICVLEDEASIIYCCVVKLSNNEKIQVSDTRKIVVNRKI